MIDKLVFHIGYFAMHAKETTLRLILGALLVALISVVLLLLF